MACTCGHTEEEHGNDPKFPGSTACNGDHGLTREDPCQCIAYEEADEESEG